MNYPLELSFKLVALAPQIFVRDSTGQEVCYIKQKLFKLKEAVKVFTDSSQTTELCDIKADSIIDFSATYNFIDADGNPFGAVRRKGMRSLWKAHYQLTQNGDVAFEINEENGWVKVMDSVFSSIPSDRRPLRLFIPSQLPRHTGWRRHTGDARDQSSSILGRPLHRRETDRDRQTRRIKPTDEFYDDAAAGTAPWISRPLIT